jgi:hypothetical protein
MRSEAFVQESTMTMNSNQRMNFGRPFSSGRVGLLSFLAGSTACAAGGQPPSRHESTNIPGLGAIRFDSQNQNQGRLGMLSVAVDANVDQA